MLSKLKSHQRGGKSEEDKTLEMRSGCPFNLPPIPEMLCHLLHMNIQQLNDISRKQSVFKISIISNHILKDFAIYLSFLGTRGYRFQTTPAYLHKKIANLIN